MEKIQFGKDGYANAKDCVNEQDRLKREYGVDVSGGMVNGDYHKSYNPKVRAYWDDPKLKRITRLRLLGDVGYPALDISYCHGELIDGTKVHVDLPMLDLPYSRNGKAMWAALYAAGNKDGVRVNRLFAGADISILR